MRMRCSYPDFEPSVAQSQPSTMLCIWDAQDSPLIIFGHHPLYFDNKLPLDDQRQCITYCGVWLEPKNVSKWWHAIKLIVCNRGLILVQSWLRCQELRSETEWGRKARFEELATSCRQSRSSRNRGWFSVKVQAARARQNHGCSHKSPSEAVLKEKKVILIHIKFTCFPFNVNVPQNTCLHEIEWNLHHRRLRQKFLFTQRCGLLNGWENSQKMLIYR